MTTPEEIYKSVLEEIIKLVDWHDGASSVVSSYVLADLARKALEDAKHCNGSVAPILKPKNGPNGIKLKAAEALVDAESSHIWTEVSLLGLFYKLYETEMGSSYTLISSNARADLVHIRVLVYTLGDLSIFALRAFFSPAMKWVVNKRLDFFSRDNVERFVRPLAHAMAQKDRRRPEWAAGTKARGLVHIPKGG